MKLNESIVEQAALDWLGSLGYEVLSGLAIAPGEPAAERSDYKQVFLFERLQTKLEDLNPKIPLEGLQEALRIIRLISPGPNPRPRPSHPPQIRLPPGQTGKNHSNRIGTGEVTLRGLGRRVTVHGL
jgi:hypothetical protein